MSRIEWPDRIKIGFIGIAWFILIVMYLFSIPAMLAWTSWVFFAALVVGLVLAIPVFFLFHLLLRNKEHYRVRDVLGRSTVAMVLIVGITIASPVYFLAYKVEADPLLLPNVTLTNGDKTVKLQGMIHIGMESFYKTVVYDLEMALEDGYRLYYEGVQPADEQSDQWFSDKLAGGSDLGERYTELANACGMVYQNDLFSLMVKDAERNPERHFTADVTTADMKREYDRLMQVDPDFAESMNELDADKGENPAGVEDVMGDFITWQKQGTPGQKTLAGVLCRGLLTVANNKAITEHQNNGMEKVILDYRNKRLVDMILEDPADKIYVTYGAAHLHGVIELLKETDSDWQVSSIKWMRAIAAPEHFEGKL